MNKKLNALIWTVFVGIFLTLLWILFVSVYPFKVIEFHNPYDVVTPIVEAGENLRYSRNAEKFINAPANMACVFQDDIVYALPFRITNNAIGDYDGDVEVMIPENLPPSIYIYKCVLTYKLFGIRELRYEFYTEPFTVIK